MAINLVKSLDYFDPKKLEGQTVHIVGCGAIGSTIAEILARLGVERVTLWDHDFVEPKNIANQMFFARDIGKLKVKAVKEIMKSVNPEIKVNIRKRKLNPTEDLLDGYVFLAVDSIETRREIVEANMYNTNILAVFDQRMGLESGQQHSQTWDDLNNREALLASMQFSSDQVKQNAPVSACGVELSIAPTVRTICSVSVANFINVINGKPIKTLISINSFDFGLLTMPIVE